MTGMGETPSQQIGVSNTEVQQAYKCGLAWFYGFHPESNLKTRTMGIARTRGILGHEVLEKFYRDLMSGADYDEAVKSSVQGIQAARVEAVMMADTDKLEMLNYLYTIMQLYFEHYREDIENWEILEVEGFHALEWDGEADFYLPSRLDLVVYETRGEYAGETIPVDHKFVNEFWKTPKFLMNSQMPLYIRALRDTPPRNGKNSVVKRGLINQIRTRKLKDPEPEDLFQRRYQPYDSKRIENVFENHMKSAVDLAYLKRLPYAEAREKVKAALGSPSCDFCDFRDLCNAELDGRNPNDTIAALYEPNTYGYPALEEIQNG